MFYFESALFLAKQQTNLVKTWFGEGGGGETNVAAFLLTPWLMGIKYPDDIALYGSNTLMLIIIVIMIHTHVSTYLPKKISWIANLKKFHVATW